MVTSRDITRDADLFRRAYPSWPAPEPFLTDEQVCRDNSAHADREASAAFRDGDYDLALFLVDAAEQWLPGDPGRWEKRREMIREAMKGERA